MHLLLGTHAFFLRTHEPLTSDPEARKTIIVLKLAASNNDSRLIGYANNRYETAIFSLAKESASYSFHPVGGVFFLLRVAPFSFLGAHVCCLDAWVRVGSWPMGGVRRVCEEKGRAIQSQNQTWSKVPKCVLQ